MMPEFPSGAPRRLDASARRTPAPSGLCPTCRHVKVVVSERGSTFLMCRLASTDRTYRKYPPQPVQRCAGHEA